MEKAKVGPDIADTRLAPGGEDRDVCGPVAGHAHVAQFDGRQAEFAGGEIGADLVGEAGAKGGKEFHVTLN